MSPVNAELLPPNPALPKPTLPAMAAASPRPADPSGAPESIDRLLTRLEWTVLRRLDGLLQGDFKTLWRGAGLDLADLRGYQFGDEIGRAHV